MLVDFKKDFFFVHKMVQSDPLQISSTQHVTIIGAGIKGLFAARQLCKFGYHVTIIEREKQAGGKIKTVRSIKKFAVKIYKFILLL